MNRKTFDANRRAFIGKVSFSIGGVLVAGLMRESILQAAPSIYCDVLDPCGDWHVDDICNSYPPYSLHVDSVMNNKNMVAANIDTADWHWIS